MGSTDYFRGPPAEIDRMVSLKVDNLTYRTTVEDLQKVFDKFGKIGDVYIPRSNRGSRGFAFVRFHEKRDAEDAMAKLDGSRLDGREIRIQMARYARPEGGRGGGRDRSRSRSRDRDHRNGDRRHRDDDDDRRRRSPDRSRRSPSPRDRRRSRSPARRYGRRD